MKIAYVVIGAIVLAVAGGSGGFYGGMAFAQSQATTTVSDFARQRAAQDGQTGQGGQASANDPCGFGRGFDRAGQSAQSGSQGGSGQNGTTSQGTQGGQANGQRGQGGQFGAFGGLAQLGSCVARGQIKAVNGDTVQISTANNVVTVKVNDQTIISKTDRGTIADLKAGDRVTVFSKETGASPTASGIQLQPAPVQQQ